jgi:hypothetical protein
MYLYCLDASFLEYIGELHSSDKNVINDDFLQPSARNHLHEVWLDGVFLSLLDICIISEPSFP